MSSPTVPAKQKALLLLAKKGTFAVGEVDVPQPGPGEVLVRAEAVALNPIDWIVQATGFFSPTYPAILGWEAAGTVVQPGEGITSLTIGDKVLHQGIIGNDRSTFKQYNAIAADLTARVPATLTIDEAAAIPLTLDTAALGLYAKRGERGGAELTPPWEPGGRGKYSGQPILVFAGGSSVGKFAIQLAKLSGFSPIITTASLKNAELLKSLGATHVLDRNLPIESISATVKEITKKPVQIVYDAVSIEETQNCGYDLLAPDGTIVVVSYVAISKKKLKTDKHVADISANPWLPDRREIAAELYRHIPALFESGDLKPNRVEVLPGGLAGIPAGIERLKNNEVSGQRLVAHPQETPITRGCYAST